jgi:hypothetical protein
MANPLAKSILGNISERLESTAEGVQGNDGKLSLREEELLKEVIHKNSVPIKKAGVMKPLKWDEYLEHHGKEKKAIQLEPQKQHKGMMSLEEFGSQLLRK